MDSYLLERIFPISGLTAFFSRGYKSRFDHKPQLTRNMNLRATQEFWKPVNDVTLHRINEDRTARTYNDVVSIYNRPQHKLAGG